MKLDMTLKTQTMLDLFQNEFDADKDGFLQVRGGRVGILALHLVRCSHMVKEYEVHVVKVLQLCRKVS